MFQEKQTNVLIHNRFIFSVKKINQQALPNPSLESYDLSSSWNHDTQIALKSYFKSS